MFGNQSDDVYRLRADVAAPNANLHNVSNFEFDDEGNRIMEQNPTEADATAVPTPDDASDPALHNAWGERDLGAGVSHRMAMDDFESMRRELTRLSQTQSRASQKTGKSNRINFFRTSTSKSKKSDTTRARTRRTSSETTDAEDLEVGDAEEIAEVEEFELGDFLREGHFEKRTKKVGVVFKNLTIKGVGATTNYVKTVPYAILNTFGPDLYRLLSRFFPFISHNNRSERTLINDFTGVVRNGEMMLILGRPGAGCTTFLKALANKRGDFASVSGDVSYGGISAEEQNKRYRGEVNYNPEDDQHFPTLNVFQTLKFSLMNKTRKRDRSEIYIIIDALLKMFGMTHISKSLVGNEYIRGISGGERKRLSITETLASKSPVTLWDSSTRGLDASTALSYAQSLRIMTDISNRTTLVTLYQAGEGIYELMDKVLVIDEGRMLYQGPASEAKEYFISLGFDCPPRTTTAEFLTSVSDPKQRVLREGFEDAPKTPEEFEKIYKSSEAFKRVLADIDDYEKHLGETENEDAREFKQSVREEKSKTVSKNSNFTVSLWKQITNSAAREFWLVFGDLPTLKTKAFIIVSNGLIVGSLFYGESLDTSGAFPRSGLLFFSILFLGWLQLAELMKAVSGRVVIARQSDYAFYRPSAVALARVLADFPLIIVQVIIFAIIMFFMGNLDRDVSKFWIYSLFIYVTTICITALYRMFAALSPSIDDAVRFSGTALNLLIVYTGYVIAKPELVHKKIWFGWLYYVNPVAYSFESVLTNEFSGRVMDCSPQMLIPQGPGIEPQYQGCAIRGAEIGTPTVDGQRYLSDSFDYHRSNLWRNFGVLIAFTVLYILVTVVASELFQFVNVGGGALTFKRGRKQDTVTSKASDTEKGGESSHVTNDQRQTLQAPGSEEVFTWVNMSYSVPYGGSQRKLLNDVSGYAKPGTLTALMGATGAGKTTLLTALSKRAAGVVTGDLLVDGRPLHKEFQRTTGFVEQMDVHDGTATIRESIEFSAILRQERYIPREEKLAYVDEIIDLLELREIQDALISSLGVEQRKRVTIGVELAAKPSLLFLDEPTSGLDSQSAYSIIQFLRKLSRAGHGIICTIHQPSSILIQQFDRILALNPGGNTFYFGPVGENGSSVNSYFSDRGVTCPPTKNIAEFLLETAIKGSKRTDGKRINWNEEWRTSQENKDLLVEIENIHAERRKTPLRETETEYEYASPVWLQTTTLTARMFRQHWRDPTYYYGKLFVAVIVGIFNGFTFYQLGNSVASLNDRMFSSFIIILIPPTVVNAVLPKFFSNLILWLTREQQSKIYGWFAFCSASVITEIPISIVSSVVYWLFWYWPTGLPRDSSTAGYTFFMTMLFFLFQASWGQWIGAFAPSFTVISNILPFFFVIFSLFNGVVRPYSQLDVFWKYWLYYLNPSTYWIGGVLAATLPGASVVCDEQELASFNPPPGQTCASYASAFIQQAGQGYLMNPNATENCGYCQYRDGTEFIRSLNISPNDKWRDLGIFAAFCVSNWALVYFFIWSVRTKGWSFGFGPVSSLIGKAVDAVTKGLVRVVKGRPKKKQDGMA
ncbi:MAG: hypothetical protein LQ351_001293 [Letrouitia transgressa]|nr:MAG: hypothetical protein LQ351_001293 [Letrouitia transgressa]